MLWQYLAELKLRFSHWLILNCSPNIATPWWLLKTSKFLFLGSAGLTFFWSAASEFTCTKEEVEELKLLTCKVFMSIASYPSPTLDLCREIPDTVSSEKWHDLAHLMKKVIIFVRKKIFIFVRRIYYICPKN